MFQVSNFIKIGIFKKVKIDGYNIIKHWKEMKTSGVKLKRNRRYLGQSWHASMEAKTN
jgi:hypothetical protein